MSLKTLLVQITALATLSAPLFADDGTIVRRDMAQQEADLFVCPSHGEHAFTRLMNFRVPAQAASGTLLDVIEYETVDLDIFTQTTAKPIVNVYVYGPVLGVEGADGFQGHGKREVYASVSLDDGESWKTTNISESTDLSSFAVTTPIPVPGEFCEDVPLTWNTGEVPDIHNIPLGGVLHAPGYFTPEGSGCTDCHSLSQSQPSPDPAAPHCQTCHGVVWLENIAMADSDTGSLLADLNVAMSAAASSDDEGSDDEDSEDGGPVALAITEAEWDARDGELEVEGRATSGVTVTIINAVTGEVLGTTEADRRSEFEFETELDDNEVPCTVAAVVGDETTDPVAVEDAPDNCVGPPAPPIPTTADYPGDNNNVFHAVAGNKILIAWQSRFCQAGQPAYALEDTVKDEIATYLGIDRTGDMYLEDLFVVGGDQGSLDYATEGFPQVGEVPFNCLWTARGVLREDPALAGTTEVVWFKSERLTSGRRDLTRIETQCVPNAGCAITWQEDPVGLRPGEGEGPGTGWAGATTNSQTDIWYSFLSWENFDIVDPLDAGTADPVPLGVLTFDTKPGAYVPFAVPVRLTNNARCNIPVTGTEPTYCNDAIAGAYGIKNQCADTVDIPLGPQNTLTPVCVVDTDRDGAGDLPNVANTAASRPRLNVRPRDTNGDGVTDDAWVLVTLEEDKGLGSFGFPNDVAWSGTLTDLAVPCGDPDASLDDNCVEADIGKNTFWMTFAMGDAQTSVANKLADGTGGVDGTTLDFSLLNNIVDQGMQINQPEVNWRVGTMWPVMSTADMWDFSQSSAGDINYEIFNTQIARRTAQMSQTVAKAEASSTKIMAMPLFKEGIVRQGGPADIQVRRFVAAVDEVTGEIDEANSNPYGPANMVCDGALFFDPATDYNPYYPYGLCMGPAINLSGLTPQDCEVSGSSDGVCPGESYTCTDDPDFGQLCVVGDLVHENPEDNQVYDKLLSWYECPGADGTGTLIQTTGTATGAPPACGTAGTVSETLGSNLDDQAWYMPLDVSKAHRGFIDGDFVMMLYAKSPNFKQNAVGADRYELYQRRSFTGGADWTTTPASFLASDGVTYSGSGTVTCETWRDAQAIDESHVCQEYAAGAPEQSRNMSQLQSMRFTILDPRYTPTIAGMVEQDLTEYEVTEGHFTYVPAPGTEAGSDLAFDETDIRRPDRHMIVFETGDNTTVAVGEAEPLNLNYGRAFNFGDHFQVWYDEVFTPDLLDATNGCYPSNTHDDTSVDWAAGTGFCNEFDDLEGSQTALSEEASVTSSAAGDFLYSVWGQVDLELVDGELIDIGGSAQFRRVWWLDDYLPSNAWEPGQGQLP